MRAVEKGPPPRVYKRYGDARPDLVGRIGWYCSYCEMSVSNMIEVEHVVPRQRGGDPLAWENFLLACKYCNTVKSNRNSSRAGYLWPDEHPTHLAFDYGEVEFIRPAAGPTADAALATIDLMGLDRRPGGPNKPSKADARWIHRLEVWRIAKRSLYNWHALPHREMAEQIALTAAGSGFYSIWTYVFREVEEVLPLIREKFNGTLI